MEQTNATLALPKANNIRQIPSGVYSRWIIVGNFRSYYVRFMFQLKISFSLGGTAYVVNTENTQSTFGGDVVDFLLNSIGMTLTEVTDVEFRSETFLLPAVSLSSFHSSKPSSCITI